MDINPPTRTRDEISGNAAPSPAETGQLLAEFETGSWQHKTLLVLMPLLEAIGIGVLLFAVLRTGADLKNPGYVFCLLMLLGLVGLITFGCFLAFTAVNWHLQLHEHGLVSCKMNVPHWLPWKDIAKYQEINVVMGGVATGHRLYLYPKKGGKIAVDGMFKDTAAASEAIKTEMIPGLTADAEERLAQGEEIDFKLFKLRPDGLKTAKELVAWKDLESVSVEDNNGLNYNFIVRVVGRKRPWVCIPVTSFPSREVFFNLIDRYRYTGAADGTSANSGANA